MITDQILNDSGYTFYQPTRSEKEHFGGCFKGRYHKKISGPGYVAYFIDISKYDFSTPSNTYNNPVLWEVSIQTKSCDYKDVYLNFKFDPHNLNIDQIESLIKKLFDMFGTNYEYDE